MSIIWQFLDDYVHVASLKVPSFLKKQKALWRYNGTVMASNVTFSSKVTYIALDYIAFKV